MRAVVFSSVEEAAAAFALGPVRFRCGVCGRIHISSGRGWVPCASRLRAQHPYAEAVCPDVPARPLRHEFGKSPYYYPVVYSAKGLPWEAKWRTLSAAALVKRISPALLAVPDPGAALDAALREKRRRILESFPSFEKELEAYREFLEWLKSPGPVFEVSSGCDPRLFRLRGRFTEWHKHLSAFALPSWWLFSSDWAQCMASAAGLAGAHKLVRYGYSDGVLQVVLRSKDGDISLVFGPEGLL